eukprot:8047730-Lingulodinium_polyedra.AAC.1
MRLHIGVRSGQEWIDCAVGSHVQQNNCRCARQIYIDSDGHANRALETKPLFGVVVHWPQLVA